jgi:hypothetical protein
MRLMPGSVVTHRRCRFQRLAAVWAMPGAALVHEEPHGRLMVGQPELVVKCPELIALGRADPATREDPTDRLLEFALPLVQLRGEAGCEQAGGQGDHADADDPDLTIAGQASRVQRGGDAGGSGSPRGRTAMVWHARRVSGPR